MRMLVAVIVFACALPSASCTKQPPPVALADVVDAGRPFLPPEPVVVVPPAVEDEEGPMVVAGYNVPKPRGFRRARKTDVIGSPHIEPWLSRGDIVLLDEAAFPPGTIDVGFVSMLNVPAILTAPDCTALASQAAAAEKGTLVGDPVLRETGLAATCTYQLTLPTGVAHAAIAVLDRRAFGIMAAHAPGDEKTSTAWSEVVTGMRKTNP